MKMRNKFFPVLLTVLLASACSELFSDEGSQDKVSRKPVSIYCFDDGTADDSSGNHYDGVVNGSVTFIEDTPSGEGQAVFINGYNGGFINIPYNVFAGHTSYSMSFWIKDFSIGAIVIAISNEYLRSDFPRFVVTSSNCFRLFTRYDNYDSTVPFSYDLQSIQASGWHHVVVTCEADGDMYSNQATRCLYVDGVLVDKDKDSVHAYYNVYGYDEDIITKVQIGGDRNGAYSSSQSMKIDNIRFYLVALSAAEVKGLYQNHQ